MKSCLSTPENLVHMRCQVEEMCSKMGGATLRVKVIRLQRDDSTADNNNDSPNAARKSLKQIVQIYRVEIVDLQKRGFLMIKRVSNKSLTLVDE